jgi:DNA modification methylase
VQGRWPANLIHDGSNEVLDILTGARFFYSAKASRSEREEGLDGFEVKKIDEVRKEGNPGGDNPRNRGVHERKNHHPTVKPIDLMRYLCRLVTPPGGIVLDPFMGSGTTMIAAKMEGFDGVGIEISQEYFNIAEARIKHRQQTLFDGHNK